MDCPDLDSQDHFHALRGLARLNRWSRAAAMVWQSIEQLSRECQRPLRVLDIATGGGDVLCSLATRAQRRRLHIDFSGCDVSPRAIEFAGERARQHKLDITFFAVDVLQESLPDGFDVMISSLFLHHLTEGQATALLRKMAGACGKMIVISDLRRSRRGLWLAHAATQLLTRSTVVHVDGPRSVENAFTSAEILRMAERAGLRDARVKNCWPQRFLLCWRKEQ
jgi:2-polyprenyl-3-methyl-5-hydroxy-6-metoxy-1,4-benzoquinol methylase